MVECSVGSERAEDLISVVEQSFVIGLAKLMTTQIVQLPCYAHRPGHRERIPRRWRAIVFDVMRG
jgi:hypothetical protein